MLNPCDRAVQHRPEFLAGLGVGVRVGVGVGLGVRVGVAVGVRVGVRAGVRMAVAAKVDVGLLLASLCCAGPSPNVTQQEASTRFGLRKRAAAPKTNGTRRAAASWLGRSFMLYMSPSIRDFLRAIASRACYALSPISNVMTRPSIRMEKATRCNPATVSGKRS